MSDSTINRGSAQPPLRVESREELVHVLIQKDDDVVAAILELTGGTGVDRAIEASGQTAAFPFGDRRHQARWLHMCFQLVHQRRTEHPARAVGLGGWR